MKPQSAKTVATLVTLLPTTVFALQASDFVVYLDAGTVSHTVSYTAAAARAATAQQVKTRLEALGMVVD